MPDKEKINEAIDQIIVSLVNLKQIVTSDSEQNIAPTADPTVTPTSDPTVTPTSNPTSNPTVTPAPAVDNEFEELKKALHSDNWPEAANPNLVCDPNSDKDKQERARGIIELLVNEDNLKDCKFLDYGCGEGHTVPYVAQLNSRASVGYDIKHHKIWEDFHNGMLTQDFEKVKDSGPYDVILLFDVIDHLENEKPVSVLEKAKELLTDNGEIYMRCHPWISKHATHLYHHINKSYIHLVFTESEIKQMLPSHEIEPNIKVKAPLKTYSEFIDKAGLKIVNRNNSKTEVEEFFTTPKIEKRILKSTGFKELPKFQMSLEFIDYTLKK